MTTTVKYKTKKKNTVNLLVIIVCPILILYTISLFFPLAWGFMTSLKTMDNFLEQPKLSLPDFKYLEWAGVGLFHNYEMLTGLFNVQYGISYYLSYDVNAGNPITEKETPTMFAVLYNTFSYCIGTTVIYVFVCASVAYLCSKYKYKLSGILYFCVIFVITTPIIGAQPATIRIMRDLRLYNRIWGLYITNACFATMHFLIFHAFFEDLPNTYNEAAEIDGASQLRTMYTICMPMASKMITTILLLTFITKWNDYNTVLVLMPTKVTIAFAVWYNVVKKTSDVMSEQVVQLAAYMVLALPILALFIGFKNKLMGNISLGGIKE